MIAFIKKLINKYRRPKLKVFISKEDEKKLFSDLNHSIYEKFFNQHITIDGFNNVKFYKPTIKENFKSNLKIKPKWMFQSPN